MSGVRTAPAGRGLDAVPAPLLVLVAIASVQTGSAVARTAFDEVGAAGMVLLRLGLSSLLLLALLRPAVHRWTRQQWGAVLLLGSAMAGMNLVFYLSLRTVDLGVAVTVEFLGPLLVALVQTRRWRDAGWALLAAAGVALLGLGGVDDLPVGGLVLAFVAGLFWGGYILASARVGSLVPGTSGLAVALAVAGLVALPFGASGASAVGGDPSLLLVGLAVAVLSSVVPYSFELAALRRIPTRVFGVLMALEPAAAALAGLVVLSQALGPRELVALVLVSLASVGVTLSSRGASAPAPPLD
ncbi:EamA family transporter [Vallicoccus soli]|uniref:EamA family transporter n=1 Tax=Vallicoccus soli TaxID=2339232 RepID=UPI001C49B652|nr:EamA family transporter [Vallicoccus soli]